MITFMESFLRELDHEAIGTKKMLQLVPADKPDWKPHAKSMKLKDLATHIADMPTWITLGLTTEGLDFATSPYNPADCNGGDELVAYFEKNVQDAKRHLTSFKDDVLEQTWTMRNGEIIYMQQSRLDTLRHAYCQLVHHRAQLGVYLRLLDIPIPGVYGPSADEQAGM